MFVCLENFKERIQLTIWSITVNVGRNGEKIIVVNKFYKYEILLLRISFVNVQVPN